MISVQNHRRLLSGNNILFFIILIICGFGCTPKTSTKVQSTPTKSLPPKKYDPVSGKSVVDTEVKGPVRKQKYSNPEIVSGSVTTKPVEKEEEVEDETKPVTTGGDAVALVLPFMGSEFQQYQANIPMKSTIAVEYYAGAKLAFEKLAAEGHDLLVKVHDSQASTAIVDNLIKNGTLNEAGLIMGGIKDDAINKLTTFAAKNKKVFVSPLLPAVSVNDNCLSCYQFNPSFEAHSETILNHAKKDFASSDIILLVRSKAAETRRLDVFRKLNQSDPPLQEMVVNFPGEIEIAPLLTGLSPKCVIIPSWSNESFIQEALRVIRIAKQSTNTDIRVYGMPQWLDMEKLSYDNFEELNLHISTSFYLDKTNPEVGNFRTRFFNTYGKDPSEFAYKGYDITYYFAKKMVENKEGLKTGMIQPKPLLHTQMEFTNQQRPDSPLGLSDYWENRFVQLLKFNNYSFQPVY